jgi:hypothetical protein
VRLVVLAVVVASAAPAAADPVLDGATTPYPGVRREAWADPAIPARLHVLRVDLSLAELTVFATAEPERGARPSRYAQSRGAQIAVNGDAFAPATYVPLGLAVGDGAAWSTTADDARSGFLRFGRVGERTQAEIVPPEAVVAAADLPAGTQGVVSGRPLLVRAGQPTTGFDCTDAIAIPCSRAPRTAVALSADRNTLWVVVVDGWQASSLGMTAMELAAFVDRLGAHDALALDGGAAATLYVAGQGGVVSSPSDGVERIVANHLAIRHGALTPGQLVGFIRERDVFDGRNLSGARVVLDDGRVDVTAADGLYNFPGVSPRLACVRVELAGFRTETKCKQVISGEVNYNSVALYPCSDFPEGCAPPPDAAPAPDAARFPDAGGPGDGGDPLGDAGGDPGDAGGCGGCGAASGRARGPIALVVVVLGYRRARRKLSPRCP